MLDQSAPKIIALYLPQFHRVPENDEWWGVGFTEWTNTRKSVPLFAGHYQPREPFAEYYDLTDPTARKWQADIAKMYGIYGFCYYHYWFNGKMLLEKPFNEVLKTGEPNFPFCLSWANGDWTRTWDGRADQMLIKQTYGDETEWKLHFDYLLAAFKDERYIKIDNKPLLCINNPTQIVRYKERLIYWEQLAINHGFDGIHITELVGNTRPTKSDEIDAWAYFEPINALWECIHNPTITNLITYMPTLEEQLLSGVNYDTIWEYILNREIKHSENPVYLGAFVDWDNSARRGVDATIFIGATPEKFGHYFNRLVKKAKQVNSEFIFINAWNEWAEGTYLEPDKKYSYKYLQEVWKSLQ